MVRASLIQTDDQFDQLACRWDSLVAASDHDSPFRRWRWVRSWWRHYGSAKRLSVVAVWNENQLIGVAPLFVDQPTAHIGTRSLQFMGTGQACGEYLGFVIRAGHEAEVVPAIFDALTGEHARHWDVMRLTDVPAESRQIVEIEAFTAARRMHFSRRAGTKNLVVDFPGDWDAFLKSISTKRRTKLRRALKTFEHDYHGEYEIVATRQQYDRIWPELERLHNLHWSDVGKQGCFETTAFQNMHRELSEHYLDNGELVLASLRVEGRAIAACYGFRQGDTVYEYQRGHDPQWLAQCPGHALQYHMFEQLMNAGVRRWDYLRGEYQHKRDWATGNRATLDLFAAAPRCLATPRYFAEHGYRTLRGRLKNWRDQVQARRKCKG